MSASSHRKTADTARSISILYENASADASPTDGNSSAKRDPAGASHTGINSPAKKIMSGMTAIDSSVLCVTVLQA